MGDQDWQDPLEFFHPKFLFQASSEADDEIIKSAEEAIATAKLEALTPEIHAKYQDQWARASSQFSSLVKSGGICQVTGAQTPFLNSSHILPFSASNDNPKTKQYLDLVKALFGPDALQRLLENVLNGDKDTARNINRLDNGIAMLSTVHDLWDGMSFYFEVLWDTLVPSSIGSPPGINMSNYWKDPLIHGGLAIPFPIVDGDIIPFCRRNPPSSSSATAPSPISTLSTPSTPSLTRSTETPLPSAHLLYVREILTQIAHVTGAAGYPEYDYYNDDDDDVSVLASDLGEEETEQAEEKVSSEEISQVAAWAEKSSSGINEHLTMTTQNEACIDGPSNTMELGKNSVEDPRKMTTLGKRRRSWTEGMALPLPKMLPRVPVTKSDVSGLRFRY